jgi:hypothetical protein
MNIIAGRRSLALKVMILTMREMAEVHKNTTMKLPQEIAKKSQIYMDLKGTHSWTII